MKSTKQYFNSDNKFNKIIKARLGRKKAQAGINYQPTYEGTFTSNLLDVLGDINTDGTITANVRNTKRNTEIAPTKRENPQQAKPELAGEAIKNLVYRRYLYEKECAEGDAKACYDNYIMLKSIDPNAAEDYAKGERLLSGTSYNLPKTGLALRRERDTNMDIKDRVQHNPVPTVDMSGREIVIPTQYPESTNNTAANEANQMQLIPTPPFPSAIENPALAALIEQQKLAEGSNDPAERRSQMPAAQTSATQPTEATAPTLEEQLINDAQALEALYNSNYVTPGGYNTENFSPMMPDPNSYTTPYIQTIFPFLNPYSSTTTSPNSSSQTAATASTTSAPVAAPAQQAAGAQGSTGPTGATGAQGAQGTAGTQGAAGTQAQQTTVTPAQVSASTPGLNMASNAPEAITFGATGPYSRQDGDLVIPSEQGDLVIPSGSRSQPEMPTYETPRGLTGVQSLPVATNLLSSILLPKGFNFEDYRMSQDDSIIQKKDITPDLQDVDKMTQMGRNAISTRAASTGELLVGLSRLTAMGMAEMGKIRNQQYSDYLQQLEAQKLRNLQIAQMNSQTRAAVDAANADLEKERLNLINAAATEASKVADALRQENLSKYEIEVLYKMYPYLAQISNQ